MRGSSSAVSSRWASSATRLTSSSETRFPSDMGSVYQGSARSRKVAVDRCRRPDTICPISSLRLCDSPMNTVCKHPKVRIVAREEDAEYVECLDCGEVFDSGEFRDMAIEETEEEEAEETA